MEKYEDIINLPHHVSATRPQMSMMDRAAQFAELKERQGEIWQLLKSSQSEEL